MQTHHLVLGIGFVPFSSLGKGSLLPARSTCRREDQVQLTPDDLADRYPEHLQQLINR